MLILYSSLYSTGTSRVVLTVLKMDPDVTDEVNVIKHSSKCPVTFHIRRSCRLPLYTNVSCLMTDIIGGSACRRKLIKEHLYTCSRLIVATEMTGYIMYTIND